jgi:enhancing lycopene biosynthesis protein 2
MAKRVGVVLSGCGVNDGSEIHEAVCILLAIDQRGAQAICIAPDIPQRDVVNHLKGQPEPGQQRRVLEESARIARGRIRDIATVQAGHLDALVFPGGFGAAKNLCDFAVSGATCQVNDQVARLLRQMHQAGKPIGLACIAPVIAAKVFGAMGVKPLLTIGTSSDVAGKIEAMGGRHEATDPTGVCVDRANKIATTPCYMNDVGPWTVYLGADAMVEEVLKMV